ncbi:MULTISPECIES: NUDIX hydrolase [Pseudofrankia]|uniref:NUDIX hydrolase n=1 Tax=Pseudofrankia TaxID=2994363 RepID=UPI0004800883|nr:MULTISPECIES: NUDIX domain-containing protein [Pseudofrankia]OHV30168.1 DNA mismatch repair protein MutT [Pseudofrankia sp. EUN1h]
MKIIDKLAWIRIEEKRILSTRSKGKDAYYIPGGKREGAETDREALQREITEELCVRLLSETMELAGVFEAQAHGKSEGVIVRMTCYRAEYDGELAPSSEIEEMVWLDYSGREKSSLVDQIIFDWLRDRGEL